MQIDKLKRLRAERDPAALKEALDALTRAADRGNGNLLALAIDAARAKATVGEISIGAGKSVRPPRRRDRRRSPVSTSGRSA